LEESNESDGNKEEIANFLIFVKVITEQMHLQKNLFLTVKGNIKSKK
jgi:hypothetical protein